VINIKLFFITIVLILNSIVYPQNTIAVTTLDKPIKIDGILETDWTVTDSISNFTQLEPENNSPATRETVVRIAQYKNDLYFSFKCYIHKGDKIAARIQKRDQLEPSDDIVSVLLDTYNDKRTSLLFQINALGTLNDAKVNNDGINIDILWDTEWEAKTSLTEFYWIAEIRIPYKSLQYNPESTIWGINFGRTIRSNQETVWWSPVTENYRVSQSRNISGLIPVTDIEHNINIYPYWTLQYENNKDVSKNSKLKNNIGLDLKYLYHSNILSNITINPDFATVEGDEEEINLTPWEISFPEKRIFFQNGNEMFDTRINTFYSRRIGDLQFGGKIIGKLGKNQFNVLSAKTNSNVEYNYSQAWFNAFRIKRDILESSTLGLTYSDKITASKINRSFSLDYTLNLDKDWKLTGQIVGSTPGRLKSHSAWFIRFAKENNIFHYHIRYSDIGAKFKENINETGFIKDDNRRELDSDVSYRFWLNEKIKYIELIGKNNVFWSQENILRSWDLKYGIKWYLDNRFSIETEYKNEYKLLDRKYYNYYYLFELGYNTDEAAFINFELQTGKYLDQQYKLSIIETEFQLIKNLSITYEGIILRYTKDASVNNTNINILGLDYFFNKNLWIRIFSQNNSLSNNLYFYGMLGWRFNPPFGAIYLIVNADKYDDDPGLNQLNKQNAFLKLTVPLSVF